MHHIPQHQIKVTRDRVIWHGMRQGIMGYACKNLLSVYAKQQSSETSGQMYKDGETEEDMM